MIKKIRCIYLILLLLVNSLFVFNIATNNNVSAESWSESNNFNGTISNSSSWFSIGNWNGSIHAPARPNPPYNILIVYDDINGTVNVSWQHGNGSSKDVVVGNTTYWSDNPNNGTQVQNSTKQWIVFSSIINYYTIWSWNQTNDLYSLIPLRIEVGALSISVYDENSTLNISSYNLFITNYNGSLTYRQENCSNTTSILVEDIPYGNRTVIVVSCAYYQTRLYYDDFIKNHFYECRFYLPPLNISVEEGAGDITENCTNKTQTLLYMLYVINEFDDGIEDTYVEVKRYFDTVGTPPETVDAYETISSFYTDGNGQHEVYLIPDVVYKIFLSKDGYISQIADYIPDREIRTHTMKLYFVTSYPSFEEALFTNLTWWYTPLETYQHNSFNFTFYMHSSDNKLEWMNMTIYYYNTTTETWVLLNSTNDTSADGALLTYTFPNTTGEYKIILTFKKDGFPAQTLIEKGSLPYWISRIQQSFSGIPDIAYLIGLIILMIIVMAFLLPYAGIGTGYIGLGIFAIGLVFNPALVISGVGGWMIFSLTFIMYTIGVFLWSRL